jgi:hypothetical protein
VASLANQVRDARDRLDQAQRVQLALHDMEHQLQQETALLHESCRDRETQLRKTAAALAASGSAARAVRMACCRGQPREKEI